jgi:hypothetical protein|nr:MAG: hypothetical protein [Bacteriophage sp.]
MERLTKRDTDGQAMMDCEKCKADWTGKHGKPMADCTALYCRNRLKNRLAAYEDTGLEPEEVLPKDKADEIALKLMRLADLESLCSYTRLRELADAEKDGRVVVLPCKVGDTVWAILDGAKYARECKVDFVNIGSFGTTIVFVVKDGLREQYGVTAAAFGKTVFLTRKEAEKALEAKE